MIARRMADIRARIRAELARRELTRYQLWKMVEGKTRNKHGIATKQTIYNFLADDEPTPLNSDSLELILEALALDVTPKK